MKWIVNTQESLNSKFDLINWKFFQELQLTLFFYTTVVNADIFQVLKMFKIKNIKNICAFFVLEAKRILQVTLKDISYS